MPRSALEEIIAVEREIQAEIDEELHKTREWLEAKRESVKREKEEKISAFHQKCELLIAEAEEKAEREVAAEIKKAEAYADFLKNLPDDKLLQYLKVHLPRILPEKES